MIQTPNYDELEKKCSGHVQWLDKYKSHKDLSEHMLIQHQKISVRAMAFIKHMENINGDIGRQCSDFLKDIEEFCIANRS